MSGQNELSIMTADGLNSWTEAFSNLARKLVEGKSLPVNIKNEGDLIMLMQAGKDLGMTITEALNSMAFINGKVSIFGPKVIERAKRLGYNFSFDEKLEMVEIEGKTRPKGHCTCTMWKGDDKEDKRVEKFDTFDAGQCGLLGKDNWIKYTKLMLRYRAFGMCCKFFAPEVYGGLSMREEIKDMGGEVIDNNSSLERMQEPTNDVLSGFTASDEMKIIDVGELELLKKERYEKGDFVTTDDGKNGIVEDVVGNEAIVSIGNQIITLSFSKLSLGATQGKIIDG